MEKSIENIWKKGFELDQDLTAPKVSNLYNNKSQQLVDKLSRALITETKVFLPIAGAVMILNPLIGNSTWSGIPASLWCVAWYFIAKKQVKKITDMDRELSCLTFLKSFQEKVLDIFKTYEKILISGTPLFLLPVMIYTYYNNIDKTMGEILGIDPSFDASKLWLFASLPIMSLIAYMVFKLSVKIGYGKTFRKLRELIQDIEAMK
ncbi:MAG: hypothetical protein HRT68_05665 [Flavobacteriaceae bacterium]|nr:hypothetical protein [Flavobacteriaceae bacterium]